MTYFIARKREILNGRDRRPRRCDIARALLVQAREKTRIARMKAAAMRLAKAMA